MRATFFASFCGLLMLVAVGCQTTRQERTPVTTDLIVAGVPLVEMSGFSFTPAQITVAVGDTVEWRNTTRSAHTVTCHPQYVANPQNVRLPEGAEPFYSGTLQPGESFFFTFQTPGRYRYVCLLHEEYGMIGEVNVIEPYVTTPRERGRQASQVTR